jgi:hypothetical protein
MADDTTDTNGAAGQDSGAAGKTGAANNAGGQAPPAGTGGDAGDGMTLDAAKQIIADLRKENAKHRTNGKEANATLEKLKTALGLGETKDPDALSKQVAALQKDIATERVKNTFNAVASKLGADVPLAFAYLKASGALDSIDTSADLEKQIEGALSAALKEVPKLKANAPATKNGADFAGAGADGGKNGTDMNAMLRKMARIRQ